MYHLAVVIDDFDSGVTHVIRGEDHISNTARQILLQQAIGAPQPTYVHIPLILAQDRSKLSKRHGAVSVNEYRKEGYLPEAMINFLALLGWSPQSGRSQGDDEEEIFTLDELIQNFSLEHIQKGSAVFNKDKLNWINRQHIKLLSKDMLFKYIEEYISEDVKTLSQYSKDRLKKSINIITERIDKFSDIKKMDERGELSYLFDIPTYDAHKLLWKEIDSAQTKIHIDNIIDILLSITTENFRAIKIKEKVWDYATENGRGNVLWPMRYALSGLLKSPDPFTLAYIFDKEETLRRLKIASEKLANISHNVII